jgi:hypothetical protein
MMCRVHLTLSRSTNPNPVGLGLPFEDPSKFNLTKPLGGGDQEEGMQECLS